LKRDSKALRKESGFTKIVGLGADLAPKWKMRATADELRVHTFSNAMCWKIKTLKVNVIIYIADRKAFSVLSCVKPTELPLVRCHSIRLPRRIASSENSEIVVKSLHALISKTFSRASYTFRWTALPLEVVDRNNFAAELYHLKVENSMIFVFFSFSTTKLRGWGEFGGSFWCQTRSHMLFTTMSVHPSLWRYVPSAVFAKRLHRFSSVIHRWKSY